MESWDSVIWTGLIIIFPMLKQHSQNTKGTDCKIIAINSSSSSCVIVETTVIIVHTMSQNRRPPKDKLVWNR